MDQWRASIGCFASTSCNCKFVSPSPALFCINKSNVHFVMYVLTVLLIIGGIESNPGPVTNEDLACIIAEGNKDTHVKLNSIEKRVAELTQGLGEMRQDLAVADTRIRRLEEEKQEFTTKIDKLENALRKNNLLVFGLPDSDNNANMIAVFTKFCFDKLLCKISENDVESAYRLGKRVGQRPLFVSFVTHKVKNTVMQNANKLKGTKISLSDDLTPQARADKKFLLKCAAEARVFGKTVKLRPGLLLIDQQVHYLKDLRDDGGYNDVRAATRVQKRTRDGDNGDLDSARVKRTQLSGGATSNSQSTSSSLGLENSVTPLGQEGGDTRTRPPTRLKPSSMIVD